MAPKRFLDGFSNRDAAHPMGNFPYLDPIKYSVYIEDFLGDSVNATCAATTTAVSAGWKFSNPAAGTFSLTQDADANGCLTITTTAVDSEFHIAYTVAPAARLRAGKKAWLDIKFENTVAGTIGQEDFFIGLADYASANTTPATNFFPPGAIAADDTWGILTYDASAEVSVVIGENDVRDIVPVGTAMVSGTWMRVTQYFDGTDLYYYVNDVAAGAFTPTAIPVSPVGPAVYYRNGEAQIKTLKVDYIALIIER